MTNTARALLGAALSLGMAGGAIAQATAADCLPLADAAARLACYDRLHGRVLPPPTPSVPATETAAALRPLPEVAPAPKSPMPAGSLLALRWDLDAPRDELFAPRAYKPVYLLPVTWTDHLNLRPTSPAPDHSEPADLELRALETKYQLSLKAKLAHSVLGTPVSLWGGYTQSSRWQVYNGAASRPFRETNYEPELMVVWPMQGELLGWRMRMGSLSLNHQSNGRSLPLSRSWNRIIGTLALERGDWVAELRPWVRIREGLRDDDNPDMADHIGRGEVLLSRYREDHAFTLQLRHSLRAGARSRGSAQLEWVFPLTGALHGYFQLFNGHGESLVDYNLSQTKIGLGVTIAGWR
ncbi:MAG: phospholipase A [Rubrivivax sp.]|nr:phospholipase A [Rubrivivax sp.]